MSEFKFSCPNCQQNIQATPEYSGAQINCPNCQTPLIVPQVAAVEAPAPAAAPKGKLSKAPSTVHHAATSPVMAATTIRQTKKPRTGLYVGLGVGAAVVVAAIIFVPKLLDKYNEHKEAAAAAQAATNAPPPPPPDLAADEILKKVGETYKGLTSYRLQGASVGTIDMSQLSPMFKEPQMVTTKLSLLLGRPDHYRMEWDRKAGPQHAKGAVWSAGKGDFLRTGTAATKMKNQETALTTAAASSGTLALWVAALFFDDANSVTASLKHYAKTNNETLDGQKCYVLTGQVSSQNVVFWVHKSDFLIAQAELILGGKVDDAATAGLTAAQKNQLLRASKIKGNFVETYESIETNKVLNASDFEAAFTPNATPKPRRPRDPNAPEKPPRVKAQ